MKPASLLWAAIVLLLAVLLSQCTGRDAGRDAERLAIAERNAATVAAAYRATRDSLPALASARVAAERDAARVRARLGVAVASAGRVTDSSRTLLNDANAADASRSAVLVAQLAAQVAVTDTLLAAVDAEVAARDSLEAAHTRERLALLGALDRADTVIAANARVITALQAQRCRVLGLPCPSRTTAFVGGAVVALAVVVAVR